MAWRAWLPDDAPRRWQALLIGAGLAGLATAARAAIALPIGHELPFITYFPALIFAAALGGMIGGTSCLLLARSAPNSSSCQAARRRDGRSTVSGFPVA